MPQIVKSDKEVWQNRGMANPNRVYAGVSAAERGRQRRQSLLEAAFDIVGTRGAASLTVGAMCRLSGVTERYYYALFKDLDEVIVQLFEQQLQSMREFVLAEATDAALGVRASMRAGVAAAINWLTADPRRVRIVMTEGYTYPALVARRDDVTASMTGLLLSVGFVQFRKDLWPRSAGKAVFGALYMVGGLNEAVLAWMNGALDVAEDELVDMCTEMFIRTGEYVIGQSID